MATKNELEVRKQLEFNLLTLSETQKTGVTTVDRSAQTIISAMAVGGKANEILARELVRVKTLSSEMEDFSFSKWYKSLGVTSGQVSKLITGLECLDTLRSHGVDDPTFTVNHAYECKELSVNEVLTMLDSGVKSVRDIILYVKDLNAPEAQEATVSTEASEASTLKQEPDQKSDAPKPNSTDALVDLAQNFFNSTFAKSARMRDLKTTSKGYKMLVHLDECIFFIENDRIVKAKSSVEGVE